MKRLIAMFLTVVMCLTSLCLVVSVSALETMPLSVTATEGAEDRTVIVTVQSNQSFDFATLVANVEYDETVFTRTGTGTFNTTYDMGYDSSSDGFMMSAKNTDTEPYMDNVPANTTLVTYTFAYAEDAEARDYTFTLNLSQMEDGDFESILPTTTTATTTYTISGVNAEPEPPTIPTEVAYTADLSSTSTAVKVGDTITVDILVGGTNKGFASSELELTYEGLTFVSGSSMTLTDDTAATITGAGGTVKIVDYGKSYTWEDGQTVAAYTLTFTVDAIQGDEGTASVTIADNGAALSTAAAAASADLTAATVTVATKEFAVTPADLTVTLPDGFTGDTTIEYNEGSVTIEAEDKNYDYTLSASNGTLTDNQDGTWTLTGVTENVTVSITKQDPKTYTITFNNLDHIQNAESLGAVNNAVSFTYNPDATFSFVLKDDVDATTTDGTVYTVASIVYEAGGNVTFTPPTTGTNRTYTISGANITGNIVITTSAQTVTADQFTVTLPTGYDNELKADPTVVDKDGSTTLTLTPEAGYKYTIKYTMGNNVEETLATGVNEATTYTIESITANVTVTVTKEFDETSVTVTVDKYLELNGQDIYLVTVTGDLEYTYDGNVMYYSAKYNNGQGAYVYLIIEAAGSDTTALTTQALAKIGLASSTDTVTEIVYTGDVNKTTNIDANDAQLVWNIYNDKLYSNFDALSMEKFLRADVQGDGDIDINDASEIINTIKTQN